MKVLVQRNKPGLKAHVICHNCGSTIELDKEECTSHIDSNEIYHISKEPCPVCNSVHLYARATEFNQEPSK